MEQEYTLKFDNGHYYTRGSGFGADSFSGIGYLNFPPNYAYMRNCIYRDDNVLRPPYQQANYGLPVGTGAIKAIFTSDDYLFAISNNGNLYYTNDYLKMFKQVYWSGTGSQPVLPSGQYSCVPESDGYIVFKPKDYSQPTYIIDPIAHTWGDKPVNIGYQHGNYGRTGWYQGLEGTDLPLGTGVIVYNFTAPDEAGMVVKNVMYGNNKTYDMTDMSIIKECPNVYASYSHSSSENLAE